MHHALSRMIRYRAFLVVAPCPDRRRARVCVLVSCGKIVVVSLHTTRFVSNFTISHHVAQQRRVGLSRPLSVNLRARNGVNRPVERVNAVAATHSQVSSR